MTTKKDPKDAADEFISDIDYMRTLLRAAEDKVRFYLSNRDMLGPYRELLAQHAQETDTLLDQTKKFLEKMERDMETVADLLYEMDQMCAPAPC